MTIFRKLICYFRLHRLGLNNVEYEDRYGNFQSIPVKICPHCKEVKLQTAPKKDCGICKNNIHNEETHEIIKLADDIASEKQITEKFLERIKTK